jgi:hypothetical protein
MRNLKNISCIKRLLIFLMGIMIVSCSEDDDAEIISTTPPGKSELVLPLHNTECEIGEVIANMAEVVFEWNEAIDAERYDLIITNLTTEEITRRPNLTTTSLVVRLERGYPYSWKVISKNSGEETTTSDSFRFYVAGEAGFNNAPFPAT